MKRLLFGVVLIFVAMKAVTASGWVIERRIHEGATLDGYARYLESSVEEIKKANPRFGANLKVGESIKIPSNLPDLRALENKAGDLALQLTTALDDARKATEGAESLRKKYERMDYLSPFIYGGLAISVLMNVSLAFVVFKRKRRRVEDSLRHVNIKVLKQRESEWLMKPTTTTGKINNH
ncbi:MAG: hypothetical protein UW74_C0016G0001 [Candidatus Giovannonibacteria bacterium GW2011_GWC2_44_8]|uniref:LysM domain-containing protein n=1 Tax=Candidatus Giovannonibacteria bacterium GW2011_GWC2_44_8 TaxID=1618657 RepID=A0A0G1MCX5_9BACT|nr:MAG: hypothetical protein UW74_C0016G0001 [Candidatus Giovannonibacteria bacterium GW2011_GWC2_44_8]